MTAQWELRRLTFSPVPFQPNCVSAQLIAVCFLQKIDDGLSTRGLSEEVAEIVVPQMAGNVLERPQVVSRTIGRRNQKEQDVHVFAVEAREFDPLFRKRNRR